jgi:hypothetical protein
MRAIDRDLIRAGHYGQRPRVPHEQAEHMAAPTNAANVKKVLANSAPSTHGTKQTSAASHMSAFDPERTCSDCGPMFAFGVKADINSGTTPALGSYEGGGYERRQDEGR